MTADVPVLLISGEFDPSTTAKMGEAVASHLPNALHIYVRGSGHTSGGNPNAAPCVEAIRTDFVERGDPSGVDVSCLDAIERPALRVRAPLS